MLKSIVSLTTSSLLIIWKNCMDFWKFAGTVPSDSTNLDLMSENDDMHLKKSKP